MSQQLAKFIDVSFCFVVGGLSVKNQETALRARPDIVVATPGRLIDHLRNSLGIDLSDVEILVLDEADRLLDMGFKDEVNEILRACPEDRQTSLFSATLGKGVLDLAEFAMKEQVKVQVNTVGTVSSLKQ